MPINYENVDASEYRQANKSWLPGHVYIVDYGDGVTFKIGYTTIEPEVRLKQIAKGSVIMPMHLVMSVYTDTNAFFLENILQMELDNNHVNGEWFKLDFVELVRLYQGMQFFGGVTMYDRWYDIVPKDYEKYLEGFSITGNLPYFTKNQEQEEWATFMKATGYTNGN